MNQPNARSYPLQHPFNRELTYDRQIKSTCRVCGWTQTGNVAHGHADAEYDHAANCKPTGKKPSQSA